LNRTFIATALFAVVVTSSAAAQVKMDGSFKAAQACPALASIKKGTNPGNVAIAAGAAYRLLGKNKDQATHYWIEVPGAAPAQRWVAIACGSTDDSAQVATAPSKSTTVNSPKKNVKPVSNSKNADNSGPFYVFALSWEPAFCENESYQIECKTARPSDYSADHFSLHGLWLQPRRRVFCGVDKVTIGFDDKEEWNRLLEPELSVQTRTELDKVMPGTKSLLQRHEWIKHGTCYPSGLAETYFKDQIRLVNAVNTSSVRNFVAANIGKIIQTSDLRAQFDAAFGHGAGERVRVSCDKQGRISEITIGLKGDIPAGTDIAKLIAAAEPTKAGCPSGLVDPVN
jgi:ribonuclease T2